MTVDSAIGRGGAVLVFAAHCLMAACAGRAEGSRIAVVESSPAVRPDDSARGFASAAVSTQWTITGQCRSRAFGPFTDAHGASCTHCERHVRVLIERDRCRVESTGVPNYRLTHLRMSFRPDRFGERTGRNHFLAVLIRDRLDSESRRPPRTAQPYIMICSVGREVHFWRGDESSLPCAAVFPAGQADAFEDVPLESLLGDALAQAAAVPAHEVERAEGFQLLPQHPIVRGRRCDVLEAQRPQSQPGARDAEVQRYWIDPERQGLVLRYELADVMGTLRLRYAYAYDAASEVRRMPRRIELLRVNGPLGVQDMLSATLTDVETGVEFSADTFEAAFPAGTLVTDFVNQTQYLVEERGRKPLGAATTNAPGGVSRLEERPGALAGKQPGWACSWSDDWPGVLVLAGVSAAMGWMANRRSGGTRAHRNRWGVLRAWRPKSWSATTLRR